MRISDWSSDVCSSDLIYIAMGDTAENVAQLRGVSRQAQDEFAVRSQNLAEQAAARGFWERDITPVLLPDGTWARTDDGPPAGVRSDERRVGQECVRTCIARWPRHPQRQKTIDR